MDGPELIEQKLLDLGIAHLRPEKPGYQFLEDGFVLTDIESIKLRLGKHHWFGQGSLVHQVYPLEKMSQYRSPFICSDNGITGLGTILDPFWWNSKGLGLIVEDADEIWTAFNAPLKGKPPRHSFQEPAEFHLRPRRSGSGDGYLTIEGSNLRIRFIELENARQVVEKYWELVGLKFASFENMPTNPLWTTWVQFKNDITHDKVISYAKNIRAYEFPCHSIGIDAKWQAMYGGLEFDRTKFADPKETISILKKFVNRVTLWIVPFMEVGSSEYLSALEKNHLMKNHDGEVHIGPWWEGEAAFLDIGSNEALSWYLGELEQLACTCKVNGFKFDAGEGMHYQNPRIKHTQSLNSITHIYIESIATRFPESEVRAAWRNQSANLLFRQWDKNSTWGRDNGLASCIPQAITLNLMGYTNSYPDMIGGNQYYEKCTAELLIRWTQAVAPMPVIQFSIAPWEYGDECAQLCAYFAHLHVELKKEWKKNLSPGQPIVRPLWWISPRDEVALTCDDQYLVGDDLLVAPVLQENCCSRDVYLPEGHWVSYWDESESYDGSVWLNAYPAPLDTLPLFRRVG